MTNIEFFLVITRPDPSWACRDCIIFGPFESEDAAWDVLPVKWPDSVEVHIMDSRPPDGDVVQEFIYGRRGV